jgi:hypothetical protein
MATDRKTQNPFTADYLYRGFRLLVGAFVLVMLFRYSYLSIASLSGEVTSLALSIARKLHLPSIFGGVFGATGVLYGLAQHLLRRRTVTRLSTRVKGLERQIDKGRQSSLPRAGDVD